MRDSLFFFVIIPFLLNGCNSINTVKDALDNTPPYQKYVRSLEKADLDRSLMAKLWLRAGEQAMIDSIHVGLPFSESGYFKGSEPGARSYRFFAREGQVLTAAGSVVAKESTRFFLDLFVKENQQWKAIAHGDSTFNLAYEFNGQEQQYLIRIQPELLASVYYTFSLSLTPVLINPVAGATNKSIGSFYGDSRDGGKRSHEGVDIFAKKGTPVIAPAPGYVSRVGTSKLGGKVVWVTDSKRGNSYYFAHLDQQLVKAGTKVNQGDTLGTVGNTGNARYTPPHLHFGIYQARSRDPLHYIKTMEALTQALPWDTTLTEPDFRIKTKVGSLRCAPDLKSGPLDTLRQGTYTKVIAHTGQWFRIMLPDQKQGYIPKSQLEPITKGKRERVKAKTALLAASDNTAAPITFLPSRTSVEVLAHFENFKFVRTKEGLLGWLSI